MKTRVVKHNGEFWTWVVFIMACMFAAGMLVGYQVWGT